MPHATENEALRHAVAAERARSARLVNVARLVAISLAFLVEVAFWRWRQPYIGVSWPIYGTWWALSLAVLLVGRASDRLARATAMAVPLVDMPLFFVLITQLALRLQDAGFPQDARVVGAFASSLFALLLFVPTGLLARWQAAIVALVAMTLQGAMAYFVSVDLSVGTFMVVVLAFAAALSAVVGSRVGGLVESAVTEQARRERLGRYFSPQVAARLARDETAGTGTSVETTILFADLRGFTALTQHASGPDVVAALNEFHEAMVQVLFAYGGTLDKFLGDGIMAYFGAPVAQPDHAERAVGCAVAMQEALTGLNRSRALRSDRPLVMGIGLHTGTVIVGDVGARARREFTAIGHAVNVAARLEQLTKTLGASIVVSEHTHRAIGAACGAFTSAGTADVRGHDQPIEVFVWSEVRGGGPEDRA